MIAQLHMFLPSFFSRVPTKNAVAIQPTAIVYDLQDAPQVPRNHLPELLRLVSGRVVTRVLEDL